MCGCGRGGGNNSFNFFFNFVYCVKVIDGKRVRGIASKKKEVMAVKKKVRYFTWTFIGQVDEAHWQRYGA